MCVVLPVDCPLVTSELLRELLDAGAVPQTGPLPGAYARALVPELESRVAAGELSLRGVNPTALEVDERLVRNVNTRIELVLADADALELEDELLASGGAVQLDEVATVFWGARSGRRGSSAAARCTARSSSSTAR